MPEVSIASTRDRLYSCPKQAKPPEGNREPEYALSVLVHTDQCPPSDASGGMMTLGWVHSGTPGSGGKARSMGIGEHCGTKVFSTSRLGSWTGPPPGPSVTSRYVFDAPPVRHMSSGCRHTLHLLKLVCLLMLLQEPSHQPLHFSHRGSGRPALDHSFLLLITPRCSHGCISKDPQRDCFASRETLR